MTATYPAPAARHPRALRWDSFQGFQVVPARLSPSLGYLDGPPLLPPASTVTEWTVYNKRFKKGRTHSR
jgi:hypothetical protein